jgi:hypothetical protein
MPSSRTRTRAATRSVTATLLLALCAALLIAPGASASTTTRKQAANKALTALGSANGTNPVIVFGLKKPLHAGTRVTARKSSRLVAKVGKRRAFFFYEDSGPSRPYPHAGRVALVDAKSGRVKLSRTITQAPLVNGKLPAFLSSSKRYRSSRYRVFARLSSPLTTPAAGFPFGQDPFSTDNQPPKAEKQDVTVKKGRSKSITLTTSSGAPDDFSYVITKGPDHGTLSGHLPYMIYTPNPAFVGKDDFHFKAIDDSGAQSNNAKVTINVIPLGAPPVTTTSPGCTNYTIRQPAVVIDSLVTASDPDDATLDSATVQISNNFQNGDDLLFTDQNGITGAYDDSSGVLTLSGEASKADYQTALRSVRYSNLTTGAPYLSKDVTFSVNDAGSDSAPATKQLCVAPGGPNRRPIAGTSEGALQYVENDGAVPIDPGFFVVDDDSAQLSGATIRFAASQASSDDDTPGASTPSYVPAEDRLGFESQNGITGSFDSDTGLLTLSGLASVADYQNALRSVTYQNISDNPSTTPRLMRFQVTDSAGANSLSDTRGVLIEAVNDAPVVTPSAGSASYTEDDPATSIDSALAVGDVDSTTITGGQVKIASGFESGDALVYTDQLGIAGSYNSGTGVLTLTGTASPADYQTALRSIKFGQTGNDNPATSKTLEYVVNDGDLDSAAATKALAVTRVNDAPVLDGTDTALSYTENDAPVAVDPAISASDVDSTSFAGATVAITGNFASGEDVLAFTNQFGISGSYNAGTGVLTLSGTSSLAHYETALRSVTYKNSSDNPSTATRTVSFQVDDGGAANNLSNTVARDIAITPVNDAPTVNTSSGSTDYTEGDPATAIDSGVDVADVDDANLESAQVKISSGFESGDDLAFADQSGITGAYNSGTGVLTLSGTASIADYQAALRSVKYGHTGAGPAPSRTVEFKVNDGDADSNAATKSIDISPPVNDAPVVTTSDGSTAYTEDDPATTVDSGVTVTDADDTNIESAEVTISSGFESGDDLVFVDQSGISGVYNTGTGVLTLSGTASVADYEAALRSVKFDHNGADPAASRTVGFKVNDGDADSNTASKSIDITPLP